MTANSSPAGVLALGLQDRTRHGGVLLGRSAARPLTARRARRLDAHLARVKQVARDLPTVDLDDLRGCARGDLVETVLAGDDERTVDAKPRQCAGDRLQERGIGDADQLPPRTRGVRQRAEQVEDRAHGQLTPDGDHEARGLVVRRGEHEAEARLLDAPRHLPRSEVDPRAERLEQVGGARAARGRAVTVLCHGTARAGGDQRGGRRNVEGAAPPTGAGGVEQVIASARDVRGERAHRAGEPGELLDGLALRAQRDQEAGDLDL